jgi:carboxymethylenebutenolidase
METKNQDTAFKCADGTMMSAFVSRPKDGLYPGIIVIHEAFGLNAQIRGVARRYAQEGYVTIAPHLFTRNGEVMNEKNIESTMRYMWSVPADKRGDPDTIREIMSKMSDTERKVASTFFLGRDEMEKQMAQDLMDCKSHLQNLDFVVKEKLGIMGFCMGGGFALLGACKLPLAFCVDYYGMIQKADVVEGVRGPIQLMLGSEDDRVTPWAYRELLPALAKHKKRVDLYLYPNARHAFHRPDWEGHNEEAAKDAWSKTIHFLSEFK